MMKMGNSDGPLGGLREKVLMDLVMERPQILLQVEILLKEL